MWEYDAKMLIIKVVPWNSAFWIYKEKYLFVISNHISKFHDVLPGFPSTSSISLDTENKLDIIYSTFFPEDQNLEKIFKIILLLRICRDIKRFKHCLTRRQRMQDKFTLKTCQSLITLALGFPLWKFKLL